jgi:NACalpha-BTF3-like transcription factor
MPKAVAVDAKDDGEPLSEEGITTNHIKMVMDHTSCTRNAAIRALRETSDDMVQAVMKLTDQN